MNTLGYFQIILYFVILTGLSIPIGKWLAGILTDSSTEEMTWREYATSILIFSVLSTLGVVFILMFQDSLPLNPQNFPGMSLALAVNTAVSFVTNTNWQAYGGESTLSLFSQMVALTTQNFLSASIGLCVMAALARGFMRIEKFTIGNFWDDLKNTTLKFLLPLSVAVSLLLMIGGVPQSFSSVTAPFVSLENFSKNETSTVENIPIGPVASQIAIKQLGTNGGGYYNVNSAHPLENPSPFTNLVEMLCILLIPAACCHAFGILIKDKRQGWALYAVMLLVGVSFSLLAGHFEANPNPSFFPDSVSVTGAMEGKEVRFGVFTSALWSIITTAASNGSVNAMHDSFTPLSGFLQMLLMQLGEVIFGGVGSGLYGMIAFVLVTVFIAGLMVGRTPEYLGKKIETFEIKMVSVIVLIPCILVLLGTALTIILKVVSHSNPGAHGFSQILYAYSSMGNNNGSAFGGFSAGLPLHLWLGSVIMFISRFLIIVPILALAGSVARKKYTPISSGTLPTHTLLFSTLLIGVIFIVGALTFLPALVLGPIAEHLGGLL